jgi:hypothetical protein
VSGESHYHPVFNGVELFSNVMKNNIKPFLDLLRLIFINTQITLLEKNYEKAYLQLTVNRSTGFNDD